MFNFYKPIACTLVEALKIAEELIPKLGAKALIELRIAYGGCIVAKYYMGSILKDGSWVDEMREVKIYDNTPYLKED